MVPLGFAAQHAQQGQQQDAQQQQQQQQQDAQQPPLPPSDMTLIDFEYADWAPRGFDWGNHFCEYAGFECDYSRYPAAPAAAAFIRHYLLAAVDSGGGGSGGGGDAVSPALTALHPMPHRRLMCVTCRCDSPLPSAPCTLFDCTAVFCSACSSSYLPA